MNCEFTSLIPNPSKVEVSLEQEMADKYCKADPDIIRKLYNPMECPLEFLPWLAYALSVDVWNPNWPEQIKRAVVQNSLMMHVHKGTLGGIADALAVMGVRAEIIEWWQQEPRARRGTMQVTLWVNANLNPTANIIFGHDTVLDIIDQLNRSKRASIHYSFRLAVEASPSGCAVASSLQAIEHQRTDALHTYTETFAKPPVNFSTANSGQINLHQRTDALHTRTAAMAKPPVNFSTAHSGQVNAHQRTDALHKQTSAFSKPPVNFSAGHSGQINSHQRTDALHTRTAAVIEHPANFNTKHSGQINSHQRTDALHTVTSALAKIPAFFDLYTTGQITASLQLEAIL